MTDTKKCPECKSQNTKRLAHDENRALCLSCYHTFSCPKTPRPANIVSKEYGNEDRRYLQKVLQDVKKMKTRIKALEDAYDVKYNQASKICNEQKFTGTR